jgi:hypothetical protein
VPIEVVAEIGLLIALALAAALVLRRMSAAAETARQRRRAEAMVSGIESRATDVLDPLITRLEEVRRGVGDRAVAAAEVSGALEVLGTAADEMRGHHAGPGSTPEVGELADALDRAVRALDLVDHGLRGLHDPRSPGGLESQTALKRGILALRHALAGIDSTTRAAAPAFPLAPTLVASAFESRVPEPGRDGGHGPGDGSRPTAAPVPEDVVSGPDPA